MSNDIIDNLVNDLQPIRRQWSLWLRVFLWLSGSFVIATAIALFLGIRFDIGSAWSSVEFLGSVLPLVLLCVISTIAAFRLSTPRLDRPRLEYLAPVIGMLIWIIFVIGVGLAVNDWGRGRFTLVCARDILLFSTLPGWFLYRMVMRGFPTSSGWTALAVTLAATSIGAIGTQMVCRNDGPIHILLWHTVPVLIIVGGTLAFARYLFKPGE